MKCGIENFGSFPWIWRLLDSKFVLWAHTVRYPGYIRSSGYWLRALPDDEGKLL